MSFKIISDKEILIGTKLVELPCNIMKNPEGIFFVIEFDDLVIVNFYGQGMNKISDEEIERNIWAFNKEGILIWKIQPPTIRPYKCNPYTSVTIKNGLLMAGNTGGFDYKVDAKTGNVTKYPETSTRPW